MDQETKLLIFELNRLCDAFLTQQDTFLDGDKIRETFQALKEMGYSFVTPRIDPTSPEFDFLSVRGKHNYRRSIGIRKRREEAQKLKKSETVAELKMIEKKLEYSIRSDYWTNCEKEYFRLINRITKEIVFNYYENPYNEFGDLSKYFKIK